MDYEEWAKSVPEEITGDSLWKMESYRLGLFVADVGWHDVTKLMQDRRTLGLSDQLYRALGSISANVAEGYSRGTGKACTELAEVTGRVSTNTPSVRPERAATGTTRVSTYWERPSPSIACAYSPRLSACS